MNVKIRYILLIVIILIIGIAFFFGQKDGVTRSSPPIPDSSEAERLDKFKIPPPDSNRTEEQVLQLQEDMANQVLQLLDDRANSVVAIGDSLTQGVGDETGQGGYVGRLEELLNREVSTVSFTNFGQRGNRSDQLLTRLEEEEEIEAELEHADLIFITIGANDLMRIARQNFMNLELQDFVEERAHYTKRLQQIFNTIRMINSDAHIYLIGFYNPFEKYFPHIDELGIIVDEYNHTGITIVNRVENSSFIPTSDLFQDSEIDLLSNDQFHPNYDGYNRIATRVLEYILLAGGINDEELDYIPVQAN